MASILKITDGPSYNKFTTTRPQLLVSGEIHGDERVVGNYGVYFEGDDDIVGSFSRTLRQSIISVEFPMSDISPP